MSSARTLTVAAVALALICSAWATDAHAVPPGMPEQVPALLERSVLPVTTDIPTCATVVDRPTGEADYLVVGLANGTVNVFHPMGSEVIARVTRLDRQEPVVDACAIHLAGARTDFGVLALQGRTLSIIGVDVSEVKGSTVLPSSTGGFSLEQLRSAVTHDSPVDRVLLHDERTVYEVRVGTDDRRWGLALEPVLSSPAGLVMRMLSDRAVLLTSAGEVREFTGESGLLAADAPLPAAPAIVAGSAGDAGDSLTVFCRGPASGWVRRSVGLPDSLTVAVTIRDSLLLLGGPLTGDVRRDVGWIALVDARGEIVARSEHGRPVAAAVAVGEWIAVQGNRRNFSLYDDDLRPLWDSASQVAPVALIPADLDTDEHEDIAVVGMRMFRVATEQAEAVREVLGRPGFMRDAVVRGSNAYLDRPMLTVYYSRAGELAGIVRDRSQLAGELERSGDYVAAAQHTMTARAAAAALGRWGDADSLREEGVRLLAMPRRERATLIAVALLLGVGLWSAAAALARAPGRRESADIWVPCLLIAAGGAVWWMLSRTTWSAGLPVGGLIAGAGSYVYRLRQLPPPQPVARVAGAPIEELEMRIGEFTHGGDGSSRQGRKKLTTLAYIIQEMLDSGNDPERYELLSERLALRYKSFYPAKYQQARDLPRLARASGVAIEMADVIAAGVVDFHEAVTSCLDSRAVAGEREDVLRAALSAREVIREAADAADAVVRGNPGCSVTLCIHNVLEAKTEVLRDMGVDIATELSLAAEEDAVAIHRHQLDFVIENLVTNALRAMDDSDVRRLSFVGSPGPATYELRVSDTGPGIAAEVLREVFIPRDADSITGGLGLPHSRELLRRVGGNISVESTAVGGGTTFLVTLRFWSPERPGDRRREG